MPHQRATAGSAKDLGKDRRVVGRDRSKGHVSSVKVHDRSVIETAMLSSEPTPVRQRQVGVMDSNRSEWE